MSITVSANILGFFALSMFVCLMYSCPLKTLRKLGAFDGLTCPVSETVFSFDNIRSDIQCAFHCPRFSSCVIVCFHLDKGTCVGCSSLNKNAMTTEEGALCYVQGCGDLPSIAYGNATLGADNKAIVTCDPRFKASSPNIECMSNGVWETATCEEHDCYLTTPREYKGKRATTYDDRQCLRWDSADVVSHGYDDTDNYPESTLTEAGNYCRNPTTFFKKPWCYTKNDQGQIYSGECGIDQCE